MRYFNTKVFLADEQGAETVEWVMIAAVLAAIIAVAPWGILKEAVDASIIKITNCMANVTNGTC
jgi:Flp pilus assembly pilin Flp